MALPAWLASIRADCCVGHILRLFPHTYDVTIHALALMLYFLVMNSLFYTIDNSFVNVWCPNSCIGFKAVAANA
jgi:hypothetical protein